MIVDRLAVLVVLRARIPMLEVCARTGYRFTVFDSNDVAVILVVVVRRVRNEYAPLAGDPELE